MNTKTVTDLRQENAELEKRITELERTMELQQRMTDAETKNEVRSALVRNAHVVSEMVCKHFEVPVSAVRSKCRLESLVIPRHATFYILRHTLGISLQQIGKVFGKDHTTVLMACRSFCDRLSTNPTLAHEFGLLRKRCVREINKAQREEQ